MAEDELDTALREYAEQHRMISRLSRDYDKITQSRFYALRMAWQSLREAFSGKPRKHANVALDQTESEFVTAWNRRAATVKTDRDPLVSIVIPVFNKLDVTMRCLRSIAETWFDSIAVEVIVVDDGSSDRTPDVIPRLNGIRYVCDGENRGFVGACNAGAAIARGAYLCFLNNDTVVRNAWLDYLVSTIERDPRIGAVGSKLVYPDGTLQEAGGIIWRDATGWNYGRGGDPSDSRYNYARNVDYCSGAALLVRTSIFRSLGGFSELYAPAYYEDADLCFGVRSLGYRVVYEPRSEVIHFEGLTSGTDLSSGMKRFQEINRPKFQQKWAAELQSHFEPHRDNVPSAARRLRSGKTILVIDTHVPLYDKDAGSLRLLKILKILRTAGYHVIFCPDNYACLEPYTSMLQADSIEVLHHSENGVTQEEAINAVLPMLDYAWICRPELFATYAKSIRRNRATTILYDTIDLHFVRAKREAEVMGRTDESWRAVEREELGAARAADVTIVVTENERDLLIERGIENVHVIPTLHDPEPEVGIPLAERSGLLFIGGYNHTPNVDAAKWLCDKIMPLVWEKFPAVRLTLLGSNPPDQIKQLASDRVCVPGYINDVSSYFCQNRVFVAPLRFGAGIKGKVGQALAYSLPCVLTDVAAEGFELEHRENCLIANDAEEFADAIVQLLSDDALWNKLSADSHRALAPFGVAAVGQRLIAMLRESTIARGARMIDHRAEILSVR